MLNAGDQAPGVRSARRRHDDDRFSEPQRQTLCRVFLSQGRHPWLPMEGIEFTELMSEFGGAWGRRGRGEQRHQASHAAFRDNVRPEHPAGCRRRRISCAMPTVYGGKRKERREKMGIVRSTFIVGADGSIPSCLVR